MDARNGKQKTNGHHDKLASIVGSERPKFEMEVVTMTARSAGNTNEPMLGIIFAHNLTHRSRVLDTCRRTTLWEIERINMEIVGALFPREAKKLLSLWAP
jgi:hypothetical protein